MEYTPRRKLTREFKLEAVRQTALSEKPKAQVARELGVRVGQLRTWRLEFEKEAVTGIAKPDRSAAEDVEQLRRETQSSRWRSRFRKSAARHLGPSDDARSAALTLTARIRTIHQASELFLKSSPESRRRRALERPIVAWPAWKAARCVR